MTDKLVESVTRTICMASGKCKYDGGKCNTGRCSVDPLIGRAAILAVLEHEPSEAAIEAVARAIFDTAVGSVNWESKWYADERNGCYVSARAVLKANANHIKAEIE